MQPQQARAGQAGFTLIEALVAMMIVAMVVISFIGIRTNALLDATRARNWRLAREIAEEKLSELQAGAHEVPPESGNVISLADKYAEGWSYKFVIGEAAVAELDSELAEEASAGSDAEARERSEWQRQRDDYRKARESGLSFSEYQDKLAEDDYRLRMAEQAPSDEETEEVAIAVLFPKLEPDFPEQKDALVIKTRISTLALSGLTPDEAAAVAQSKGLAATGTSGAGNSTAPAAGGK